MSGVDDVEMEVTLGDGGGGRDELDSGAAPAAEGRAPAASNSGRMGALRRSSARVMRSAQYYSNLIVVPKEKVPSEDVTDAGLRVQLKQQQQHKELEIFPKSRDFAVPYFIILISVLELCVFLYHVVNLKNTRCVEIDAHGPVPICSVLIYNPRRRYEVWRLITYLAVHGGYLHIASNIIVQLLLGIPLEIVHGPLRVSAVYLSGVLTGALLTSVSDPWAYLAGASGGVYAILAAHLPTLVMNFREMRTVVEWMVNVLILLVGAVDLAMAVYFRYIDDGGQDASVGYAAHLGGAAAGVLVGVNVLRNFKTVKWENYLRLVSFLIWSLGVVAAVLINGLAGEAMYPDSDFGDQEACSYSHGCSGPRIT